MRGKKVERDKEREGEREKERKRNTKQKQKRRNRKRKGKKVKEEVEIRKGWGENKRAEIDLLDLLLLTEDPHISAYFEADFENLENPRYWVDYA